MALAPKGFDINKIVITGNGVEGDFIDSVKVNEKGFDGCFCGRLVEKKGVYDLVEIWEKVLKSFPESKLVIIGDGQEYDNISKIVKNKSLEKNIILTGFISEEQKRYTIESSKVFISPSYEESWGIAVSEAMACGLPVVCYNLSAYKMFGDGIIKEVVGNKEGMANTIIGLIGDKDWQESLAATAKKMITDLLDWENISKNELKEIVGF